MDPSGCLGLLVVILLLTLVTGDGGADTLPRFVSPIENVTVSVGRDARLSCVVENLHNYQVAWIYKGTGGRTVLTVATQVITKNPRVSSTQEAQAWVLTITSLTKKDQGIYMCQVNTKPVRKQMGYLHVVDFFSEVNSLNISHQGNLTMLHTAPDKVPAFKCKIQLYQKKVEDGDTTFFTQMTTLLDSMPDAECSFREISAHLLAVNDAIERYFPGLDDHCTDVWINRSFSVKDSTIRDTDFAA